MPFNHSNKAVDSSDSPQPNSTPVEIVAFTSKVVMIASHTVDIATYVASLRQYIVALSSRHMLTAEPMVTKYTRHDGQGTLMWIDNLTDDKEVLHAMQFQSHDGIVVNRSVDHKTGKNYEDVVPPMSGKLVIVACVALPCVFENGDRCEHSVSIMPRYFCFIVIIWP